MREFRVNALVRHLEQWFNDSMTMLYINSAFDEVVSRMALVTCDS